MTFQQLFKRISPTLKRITYRLNGHYASFNYDDLFQEASLYLWNEFREGTLEDKTDSYILQGCYFYLKNYLRKHRIKARLVSLEAIVDGDGKKLEDAISLEDPGSQGYFQNLDNKMLSEVIMNNGLNPREKYILSLCSEGLTTRDIGKRLGVTHVRVVKLMSGIRIKCKKYQYL